MPFTTASPYAARLPVFGEIVPILIVSAAVVAAAPSVLAAPLLLEPQPEKSVSYNFV